ncbi:MAG: hypothetical protein ACRED8_06740 [Caulobacteraceae bacterium]
MVLRMFSALAAALLLSASPTPALVLARAPSAVVPQSVAGEPLFADIARHAGALKNEVAAWRAAGGSEKSLPGFAAFDGSILALAREDMKGHIALVTSGQDNDLKCILKGIAEDLPGKLQAIKIAGTPHARDEALEEMMYLLRDNQQVITTPPSLPPTTVPAA